MTGFLSFLSSLPLQKLIQSEKENQTESKEPILEDEEGRENPEETSSAVLSKERYFEFSLTFKLEVSTEAQWSVFIFKVLNVAYVARHSLVAGL